MRLFLTTFAIFLTSVVTPIFGEVIEMTCRHSFQGNYSRGDVLLRYEYKNLSTDKAYIRVKEHWIEICSDVETHGTVKVKDFIARCSIYLANWMNGKRQDFVWDFKKKELNSQTLSRQMNPYTNLAEWKWRYSLGEVGSKDWKVISGWELDGIMYEVSKCK